MIFKNEIISSFVKDNRSVFKNMGYLSVHQAVNIVFPLITYGYLIRVLGQENYGLTIFAQAAVSYLTILVTYGFNTSATRLISIHRLDSEKTSEIVSSVLVIKALLLGLAFILLASALKFVPVIRDNATLFLFSMWACVYEVIFPMWYFQGTEKLKFITYINLLSRCIFLSFLFLVIKNQSDYLLVPVLYGVGALVSGIFSLIIVFRLDNVKFKFQSLETLGFHFKDSFAMFLTNISGSIYVNAGKVLTGASLGMAAVSYYDLAEKLVTMLKVPLNIMSQAFFPKNSYRKNVQDVKILLQVSLAFNVFLLIVFFFFSRIVVLLLGGEDMLPALPVLHIVSLTLPFSTIAGVIGIQLLGAFGRYKQLTVVMASTCLVYLTSVSILVFFNAATLVSISSAAVLAEAFAATYMYLISKTTKLW